MLKVDKRFFKSADPFIKKLLKDPEVRILFEQERAKTKLSMALVGARKRAHLTQAALAKKAGTSQSVIARIESGNDSRTPGLPFLARVFAACGAAMEIGLKFKRRPAHRSAI